MGGVELKPENLLWKGYGNMDWNNTIHFDKSGIIFMFSLLPNSLYYNSSFPGPFDFYYFYFFLGRISK